MICHRCGENLKLTPQSGREGSTITHGETGKTCCAVAYRSESWETSLDLEIPGQLTIMDLYGTIEVK